MIKEEMKIEEWYVILNMNCKYEICRMCPKSGLFKGTYEECEKWIEQKQKEEMKEELEKEAEINVLDELCARLRYICKAYKDVDLAKCTIVGGDLPFTHISDVPYLPCPTISEYHLANCDNYKACRDFEDGFKEIKENG